MVREYILVEFFLREFVTGVHRDSYASHIGHFSRLSYMAVAENESIAKTRFKLLEVIIYP
jgi:splicing factor 3B subunit 5